MKTKTMTKEQAEKAAMEFAMVMVEKGHSVQKHKSRTLISIRYGCNHKEFPYIDLAPGDAFVVSDDGMFEQVTFFVKYNGVGTRPCFSNAVRNIRNGTRGRVFDNYRPLGFNVLEIEKGWGDDGE